VIYNGITVDYFNLTTELILLFFNTLSFLILYNKKMKQQNYETSPTNETKIEIKNNEN
jgi:hypothetical protein